MNWVLKIIKNKVNKTIDFDDFEVLIFYRNNKLCYLLLLIKQHYIKHEIELTKSELEEFLYQ